MAALAEFEACTLRSFEGLSHTVFAGLPMPLTVRWAVPPTDEELLVFSAAVEPFRVERNAAGELEITSPTGTRGGSLEAEVIWALQGWTRNHGGITLSSQAGIRLPDSSIRMADAAWISNERWQALTSQQQKGFAPICPDFLIEILSESDSSPTLKTKMEMWIAMGARLAWLIDPFAATLTIYRPGEATETLIRPDWVEAHTIVPGLRLETSRLWVV